MVLHEEELIKRCMKGERKAQESLFNLFYNDLYFIAIRYLSDHQETEDTIIQSFTRIFKNLKSFTYHGPGSLGKWVRTILINEAIRSLKKRKMIQFDDGLKYLEFPDAGENAIQKLHATDLLRIIEKLPAGYRTVFNLFVVEGYSHKEIGIMLGISENTSKTQLMKARHQLMYRIKEEIAYGTQ